MAADDRIDADKTRLCSLLQDACNTFEAFGNQTIWSRHESGPAIAWQLMAWMPKVREGKLTGQEAMELWQLLAPTRVCDDVIGDSPFCPSVFEVIDRLYPRG